MSSPEAFSLLSSLRFLARRTGFARLALLAVLILASSLSEGIGLLLLVPITQVIAGDPAATSEHAWLAAASEVPPTTLLLAVVAVVSLRAVVVYATNELRRDINLSLAQQLRVDAFRALLGAQWRWLVGRKASDDGPLIMGEADRVATLLDQALFITSALLTLAVLLATSVLLSPALAGTMILAAIALAVPLIWLRSQKGDAVEAYADAYGELHSLASRGIGHLRAAKIANATDSLTKRFDAVSARLRKLELDYFRAGHRLSMILQVLAVFMLATLIHLSLFVWEVPLEIFVPLIIIMARATPLVGTLVQALRQWRHTMPALERLLSLIATARAESEGSPPKGRKIAFADALVLADVQVNFEEREDPVIAGFNLEIPHRSLIAITGHSGSGKSTIADLVGGLLAPDAGALLIDGKALDQEGRRAWRRQVAYAEQDPFLFDGTVAQNLLWSDEPTDRASIAEALAAASAEFVLDLPQGLDTPVGEEGLRFSGGEKQRLALARALLREPDLLILDEVTSALDRDSRSAIADTIAGLKGQLTILLLTHDETLVQMADKVVDLGARQRVAVP